MGEIEDAYKFVREQPLVQAFANATSIANKYEKRASENLKNVLEAQKLGKERPQKLTEVERSERSTARRILREIKRYEATGRISRFLEKEIAKQEQKNESSNSAPDSSVYESPAQNAPVKITPPPSSSSFPPLPIAPTKSEIKYELPTAVAANNCIGLNLYIRDSDVWIGAGTIGGVLPSGFDSTNGKFIANTGSGNNVWAKITVNQQNGEITLREVGSGSNTPSNTDSNFYYTLGFYYYDNAIPRVTNYGCGSLDVTVCRNWFAAEPPKYNVFFDRA